MKYERIGDLIWTFTALLWAVTDFASDDPVQGFVWCLVAVTMFVKYTTK